MGPGKVFTANGIGKFEIDFDAELVKVRDGYRLQMQNSADVETLGLEHNGTRSRIIPSNVNVDEAELVITNSSGEASPGNFYTYNSQACNDDATITFTLPRATGMIFITANFSAYTAMILGCSGTTLNQISPDNGHVDVGLTGTNPDTDGDMNVWLSSSGVLSIKNRLGSARSFGMIYITG